MRLITCSNSQPQVDLETGALQTTPGSPGGLVPIVLSLFNEVGGHWIFTSAKSGAAATAERSGGESIVLTPVSFHQQLADRHYDRISIRLFLWLFHYIFETPYEPSFDRTTRDDWSGYEAVNRRFADEIARIHRNESDEVVLVHDFHLMLVPEYFNRTVRGRRSRLAYFHHVPWCAPDYFALLPDRMRTRVLHSLLSCEFIGFHSRRWAEAFLACCARFVPDAEVGRDRVVYRDHTSVVTAVPGPIDSETLDLLRADPITAHSCERLTAQADGRRAIVRVDRLDLWKNLIRGFEAFELLLSRQPALAGDLWFCAIVTPPRKPTERSIHYRARCEATVDRINERFGSADPDRRPISLLYPEAEGSSRHRAVAALEISSVTLVNPTLDGLNMVAKEAVIAGSESPLLLSVGAGAYEQLRSAVTPVHPFDIESTAEALLGALDAGQSASMDSCRAQLRAESGSAWLNALLSPPG